MDETQNSRWEQHTLEKVALAAIREQRASRRWKIFFRSIWLILLGLIFAWLTGWLPNKTDHGDKKLGAGSYTASIEMTGEMVSEGDKAGITADQIIFSLREAFKNRSVKGVILRVNSPGGSPVAAGRIYDEIKLLRKQYPQKAIYTVVDEICASGCYYAAAATDKIFVNRASLIGSIGVLMNGFGFTGSMQKLGVERRLITAGKNKGFLDPFSPLQSTDKAFIQHMLAGIHQQFIDAVKAGRGDRLKEHTDIFSGLIWNGTTAIELGLADGQGTADYVAKNLIKAEEIVDFTPKRSFADIFAEQIGVSAGTSIKSIVSTTLK